VGHAGWLLREQEPQQASGDGQADASGVSRGGEAVALDVIANDGMVDVALGFAAGGAQFVGVVVERVPPRLAVRAVDGLQDVVARPGTGLDVRAWPVVRGR
jgi:hypothetical protein